MSRYLNLGVAIVLVAAVPAAAAQKAGRTDTPDQIARLLACRAVADGAQRLACFDRETAATADALSRKDLVAVDREKVREARRSLFGLSVPKLGILGGDDKDELKQIEGVVDGASWSTDGFRVRLKDQSRWAQTDGKPVALEPRAGDKVVIKRGALGSFLMSVAGQPSVKVQRLN